MGELDKYLDLFISQKEKSNIINYTNYFSYYFPKSKVILKVSKRRKSPFNFEPEQDLHHVKSLHSYEAFKQSSNYLLPRLLTQIYSLIQVNGAGLPPEKLQSWLAIKNQLDYFSEWIKGINAFAFVQKDIKFKINYFPLSQQFSILYFVKKYFTPKLYEFYFRYRQLKHTRIYQVHIIFLSNKQGTLFNEYLSTSQLTKLSNIQFYQIPLLQSEPLIFFDGLIIISGPSLNVKNESNESLACRITRPTFRLNQLDCRPSKTPGKINQHQIDNQGGLIKQLDFQLDKTTQKLNLVQQKLGKLLKTKTWVKFV